MAKTKEERIAALLDQLENRHLSESDIQKIEKKLELLRTFDE